MTSIAVKNPIFSSIGRKSEGAESFTHEVEHNFASAEMTLIDHLNTESDLHTGSKLEPYQKFNNVTTPPLQMGI